MMCVKANLLLLVCFLIWWFATSFRTSSHHPISVPVQLKLYPVTEIQSWTTDTTRQEHEFDASFQKPGLWCTGFPTAVPEWEHKSEWDLCLLQSADQTSDIRREKSHPLTSNDTNPNPFPRRVLGSRTIRTFSILPQSSKCCLNGSSSTSGMKDSSSIFAVCETTVNAPIFKSQVLTKRKVSNEDGIVVFVLQVGRKCFKWKNSRWRELQIVKPGNWMGSVWYLHKWAGFCDHATRRWRLIASRNSSLSMTTMIHAQNGHMHLIMFPYLLGFCGHVDPDMQTTDFAAVSVRETNGRISHLVPYPTCTHLAIDSATPGRTLSKLLEHLLLLRIPHSSWCCVDLHGKPFCGGKYQEKHLCQCVNGFPCWTGGPKKFGPEFML